MKIQNKKKGTSTTKTENEDEITVLLYLYATELRASFNKLQIKFANFLWIRIPFTNTHLYVYICWCILCVLCIGWKFIM